MSDLLLDRIGRIIDDPAFTEARSFYLSLKERRLDIYFNPQYGIVVVGRLKGVKPSKEDMDTAWTLRHEIGLIFALDALSAHEEAEKEAARNMGRIFSLTG